MLIRTHLAITLFFALLLVDYVKFPVFFIAIALISTYIPDIDSKTSKMGSNILFRPLQWISRHRGMIHSFTFLISIVFLFALFIPILSLPFFVGYSSHLLADSFTIEGIKPFYPMRHKSSGNIITGSLTETNILILFLVLDFVFFAVNFSSIF
ncbi:MAG TPA: metal-dependent hydrolase [Candidatus Nanoarchaeia archaeon]|nr:metal-dependent hydrolase [Candidatus Nanoarchaeia archaeon]